MRWWCRTSRRATCLRPRSVTRAASTRSRSSASRRGTPPSRTRTFMCPSSEPSHRTTTRPTSGWKCSVTLATTRWVPFVNLIYLLCVCCGVCEGVCVCQQQIQYSPLSVVLGSLAAGCHISKCQLCWHRELNSIVGGDYEASSTWRPRSLLSSQHIRRTIMCSFGH